MKNKERLITYPIMLVLIVVLAVMSTLYFVSEPAPASVLTLVPEPTSGPVSESGDDALITALEDLGDEMLDSMEELFAANQKISGNVSSVSVQSQTQTNDINIQIPELSTQSDEANLDQSDYYWTEKSYTVYFTRSGCHQFKVEGRPPFQLWIDGTMVISNLNSSSQFQTCSASCWLGQGNHTIKLKWVQGQPKPTLSWN